MAILAAGGDASSDVSTSNLGGVVTDRAVLTARIRQKHLPVLPPFTTGALDQSTTTVVAQALATENITLTVTINSRRFDVDPCAPTADLRTALLDRLLPRPGVP